MQMRPGQVDFGFWSSSVVEYLFVWEIKTKGIKLL